MHQDMAYTLVSSDGAENSARKYYKHRPVVLETFLDLRLPVLRSDK